MIITKIITTRLSLENPFSSNCEDIIRKKLEEKYVGKCSHSIYITKILELFPIESILCKSKTLDGLFVTDVSFEVEGIIYETNEIIHGCNIIQINDNGIMHAKSKNTALLIKNDIGLDVFRESQIIPVIVKMRRYNLFATEISVAAVPFQPIFKEVNFYEINLNKNISENEKFIIQAEISIVKDLEKEINTLKKTSPKLYKLFIKLLYPYKKERKYSSDKSIKTVSVNKFQIDEYVNNFKNSNSKIIVFRPDVLLDDDNIYYTNIGGLKNLDINGMTLEMPPGIVIGNLVQEYKKDLLKLLDFLQTYDTTDKVRSNELIWKIYNKFKKE